MNEGSSETIKTDGLILKNTEEMVSHLKDARPDSILEKKEGDYFTSREELEKFLNAPPVTIKAEDLKEALEEYVKTLFKGGERYLAGKTLKKPVKTLPKGSLKKQTLPKGGEGWETTLKEYVKILPEGGEGWVTTLKEYVKTLPEGGEWYLAGEVLISAYIGVPVDVLLLVAAGTAVLDALLYTWYHDDTAKNHIFNVKHCGTDSVPTHVVAQNISDGRKALKAAITLVYNAGSLPNEGNLPKFITSTLFDNSKFNVKDLCKLLSSVSPTKFPSIAFLKVGVNNFPCDVSSRCKLSIAGNKAIRYAYFSRKFDAERPPTRPENPTGEELENYLDEKKEHEKVEQIVSFLAGLISDLDAQLSMHPLARKKSIPKNFTLMLTRVVLESLSLSGKLAMVRKINEVHLEAFKKDQAFYGVQGQDDAHYFPVLSNPDADHKDMSLSFVKATYGKS